MENRFDRVNQSELGRSVGYLKIIRSVSDPPRLDRGVQATNVIICRRPLVLTVKPWGAQMAIPPCSTLHGSTVESKPPTPYTSTNGRGPFPACRLGSGNFSTSFHTQPLIVFGCSPGSDASIILLSAVQRIPSGCFSSSFNAGSFMRWVTGLGLVGYACLPLHI